MDEQADLSHLHLLTYWQPHLWRLRFNHGTLAIQDLPAYQLFDENTSIQIQNKTPVWLALALFDSKTTCTIPVLIPAVVENGALQLREKGEYPFIPGSFFKPDAKLYFQQRSGYEDFLRFECLDEKGEYRFSDFKAFKVACEELLSHLLDEDWQEVCQRLGFDRQAKWFLFEESDLTTQTEILPHQCAKTWSAFENDLSKEEIDEHNFFNYAHLLQAQLGQGNPLDREVLKNLLSARSLGWGLGISGPKFK